MPNLIFGILVLLICLFGYYYSWKRHLAGDFNSAIWLVIVCGLILRIFISTDFYLHSWDERYHALVAKNIISHPLIPTLYDNPVVPYDYKNWVANHIWLHKQPLPLWAMSLSLWLFGINEFALRVPSILLSSIGIVLTFLIGSHFFSKRTGYIAAVLFSMNGLILELTGGRIATDHFDVFFLFFIELAVWLSILFVKRGNPLLNLLAGISIGAAILCKWLPALIVLPMWIFMMIDSGKYNTKQIVIHFVWLLLAIGVTFLPWQIYIYTMFPVEAKWESEFNARHIFEVLEGQTGPAWYYFNKIMVNYGELIYLPILWFCWKNYRSLNGLIFITWFAIPLLFFSFARTKMQGYILFASPALFIITAEFWQYLSSIRQESKYRNVITVILVLLLLLPVRYSIERLKLFEIRDRNPVWAQEVKELNAGLQNDKRVLFNYKYAVEAMFYSNVIAYTQIPDSNLVRSLLDKNYRVIININEKFQGFGNSMSNVEYVKLDEPE
jgi:4-amino-4-deoxy-L-arabinose transferase-like glycosyltransferase